MNRTKIKNYAPQARRDFLQAITDRAAFLGLTAAKIEPVKEKGDVAVIGGRAFPRALTDKRKRLEERVRSHGFEQTMEALAYTWFNRLVAVRFMELHGYLDHGYRVLSHPDPGKTEPEILEHAEHVDLLGLDRQKIIDLKLDGNKAAELYRLLVAQCNALYSAMPFLFERIDDETELVLPDNLLHSDSFIRRLVAGIDEEDWQEVEIIGWLYESYISERYEAVIGKVVASEDIPAATQRFTPRWIVKYLVQNTLGRQWLATYPDSPLRAQMKYYVEQAEQTSEVQEQLRAITPVSLNPEEITLLDPACGSGHILVEAYDLFKAIYQERGYRAKDISSLILGKNLFGLEIDDRAAQLAAFALMMKARADDRRIFASGVQPQVMALQESKGLDVRDVIAALNAPILKEELPPSEYLFEEVEEAKNPLFSRKAMAAQGHVAQADVACLLELFEDAKTFGSLIQVPQNLAAKLPEIEQRATDVAKHGELFTQTVANSLLPLIRQAVLLARQFDAIIANPPYMGGKYLTGRLKDFVADHYQEGKADLYACFILRNTTFAKPNGFVGMITFDKWTYLTPTFTNLRNGISDNQAIEVFAHNGRGVFGSDYPSCSFVLRNHGLPAYGGVFRRLFDKQGSVASNEELEQRFFRAQNYLASPADFRKLPGKVLAYWISDHEREAFGTSDPFFKVAQPRQGLATADDGRFLRLWHEVSVRSIGFSHESNAAALQSGKKWFPFLKGGQFRRWYGNLGHIINWEQDGMEIKAFRPRAVVRNETVYFQEGITWSSVTIGLPSFRFFEKGFVISHVGSGIYSDGKNTFLLLAYLNSRVVTHFFGVLSPAAHFEVGQVRDLPFKNPGQSVIEIAKTLVEMHRKDWDASESSWSFQRCPLLNGERHVTVEVAFVRWADRSQAALAQAKQLEEENNRLFIECFGLQAQLSPLIPEDQITLARPDRVEDIKRLLSYAIGCMMGRYSLDKPGLIYAHSGNVSFDPGKYKTFPADEDGIVPLLETDWGVSDDAANRVVDFIGVAWPREHLEENLKFIADSLGPAKDERPRDTIRRYLSAGFSKDHLRWYKRRPIYWLFSSGRQRAFQALVYLHRYHEGTLARMRTEYVIPHLGRLTARIEQLESDKTGATSTSHRRRLEKEQDTLKKQQVELQAYDEKLRHHTDQRIKLDLDDGVRVNYGKFGDLLAEVRAVTGGSDE